MHGDWTLVSSFKAALGDSVWFAEVAYPRTTSWTLQQYAEGVLAALGKAGIASGWLLGESFGSQVAWKLLESSGSGEQVVFRPQGMILAGGFVQYPLPWVIPAVQRVNHAVPMWFLKGFCRIYVFYARFRHHRARETLASVQEFVLNRSQEADRQALAYRYTLIKENNLCEVARTAKVPVYQLTGFFDPIVPWIFVRRWLKRNCAAYGGWKLIWRADHNVLGTAPAACARQMLQSRIVRLVPQTPARTTLQVSQD